MGKQGLEMSNRHQDIAERTHQVTYIMLVGQTLAHSNCGFIYHYSNVLPAIDFWIDSDGRLQFHDGRGLG